MPESAIKVRKDLLDDSNAAKDVMDKVKKKLKLLLREGHAPPPQFAWPPNTPEPSEIVKHVAELMIFHRRVLRHNFQRLEAGSISSKSTDNLLEAKTLASIQARWCCSENPELFKERWEKLFSEFCDSEKVDPSKISELYDTMKFDALHNRQFLEWVFTPTAHFLADEMPQQSPKADLTHRDRPRPVVVNESQETQISYFKLYAGTGQSRAKQDARLGHLRDLYRYAKILFDYVCPQEYGISNAEKLEIGLLTSLPLLKEIVHDLEEVQASEDAKTFVYFTKESHIYTLMNCILEGGIKTKIERNAIPELDYLSSITFELYEAEDKDADTFSYSIRISITPGCHTFDPLDVQLDSKHSIGCAPRRSLTQHEDWLAVIETLRAKFHTVKLPKTFLAVNVSEAHAASADASS